MPITTFGKEARRVRIDRELMLKDQAEAMGVTAPFISSIESGRKPIPSNWIDRMATALSLTPQEVKSLKKAAENSSKEEKISLSAKTSPLGRETAMLMARNFDTLTEQDFIEIRNVLARRQA